VGGQGGSGQPHRAAAVRPGVDRRLALVGAGAGLAAGAVIDLVPHARSPFVWVVAGALAAAGVAGAVAARWWRLRQLDETMRALYRPSAGARARCAAACCSGPAAVTVAYLGLVGAAAWLTGSLLVTGRGRAAPMVLLHHPGVRLWRERVLPVLQSRHRIVRAR